MINLQRLPLDRLKPAPYNPRLPLKPGSPGYRRLERSLNEFSLVQPVVWNERTGHVVAGHQRLEILKNQGATEIDAVVVSLSLEREKALNITLNNREVGSDWDPDKLIDLVAELHDLPDFDPTLTGFDAADLRDLLLTPEPGTVEAAPSICEDNEIVRVILEIPHDRWETLRPELDRFVARLDLTLHVKLPK